MQDNYNLLTQSRAASATCSGSLSDERMPNASTWPRTSVGTTAAPNPMAGNSQEQAGSPPDQGDQAWPGGSFHPRGEKEVNPPTPGRPCPAEPPLRGCGQAPGSAAERVPPCPLTRLRSMLAARFPQRGGGSRSAPPRRGLGSGRRPHWRSHGPVRPRNGNELPGFRLSRVCWSWSLRRCLGPCRTLPLFPLPVN